MWRRAGPRFEAAPRSYGKRPGKVQRFAAAAGGRRRGMARPADGRRGRAADQDRGARRFADGRLSACRPSAAFPAQLERALKAKGSRSRSSMPASPATPAPAGWRRLDWSVPDGTDAVILELGANDMLRGIEPKVTRAALDEDHRPAEGARHRGAAVRHAGAAESGAGLCARVRRDLSRACRQQRSWCSIRSSSTASSADAKLNQRDGLHPTAAGVATIVARILPKVEDLLARVRAKPAS